jgi:peptide/nickel transport system substrate-binding protein
MKRAWFTDLNFRKAVSYAIDREALVRNAYFGKAIPAYQFESVANPLWYNDNITKYPFDPAKSLELLKQSGFRQKMDSLGKPILLDKKGNEVRFTLYTNSGNNIRATVCNMIASDLAKLGMQVQFSALDFNMLITRIMETYDFDTILTGLSHDDVDPSNGMNTWLSSGTLHFWWPQQEYPHTPWEKRIDELMIGQIQTLNMEQRKKDYWEVQQIVSDQQPMVFTVNQYLFVSAKENLGNLNPTVARHRLLWNADELYWKTAKTQ